MKCIVQKFGGSSVADIDKIKLIANKIAKTKEEGYNIAVVVSAIGKTTNQLIEMARQISSNPPKREIDMLLSTGERTTMALLCIALNELGIEAVSLTGSQAGIVTNDVHNDAKVIEVRPFRVQDEMERGKIVVVGGFQGVSYRRDITTLGRGGSDTTAVALAAALNAEKCEIYSDVPGVYSADPSIVAAAEHLPEISYQQMQEMSLAGAKVMNAVAIQFAKEANIAIYARSTFEPGKETIIRRMPSGATKGVKAVVSELEIARIKLSGLAAEDKFKELLLHFKNNQISLKELNYFTDSENKTNISFIISYSNIYGWEKIKEQLGLKYPEFIQIEETLSAISLIGEGLTNDVDILNDTISYLEQNQIKIFGIATTSFRISLLIERKKIKDAVKLCHKKWLE
ncbi:MAG: aspartate kinase [Ignavibacteriaceae bacterium]|nr:aspartate kinase [Ignavibacteriaceae bacterium]